MGCGKSKEAELISISQEFSGNNFNSYKELRNIHAVVENSKPQDIVHEKVVIIHQNKEFLEIGKEGEDVEAEIISYGKKFDESSDNVVIQHPLPKKLPGIKNFPIPSTLIPKFMKFSTTEPDENIFEDFINDNNKGFEFGFLEKDSSSAYHEKMIKKIMEDLSINNNTLK
jgi:hypothetical protein